MFIANTMQKLYKNFTHRFVLLVVFACGLGLLAKSQSMTIDPSSASPSPSLICSGDDGQYEITINGGTGPFEFDYKLNGGGIQTLVIPDNNPVFLDLLNLTATVTLDAIEVRDNGVFFFTPLNVDVSIFVQDLPTAIFALPKAYEQCQGGSTNLLLTLTGTGVLTLDIQDNLGGSIVSTNEAAGPANRIVAPAVDAIYTVMQIVDDYGCVGTPSDAATVTIKNTITAKIVIDSTVVCANDADIPVTFDITGSAATYNVTYSIGGVPTTVPNTGDFGINIPTAATTINIDAVEYDSGEPCAQTDLDNKVITLQANPSAIFTVPTAYEQCEGTTTNLALSLTGTGTLTLDIQDNLSNTVSSNYTSGSGVRTIPALLVDGTFTITKIEDALGCLGSIGSVATITVKDSIKVAIGNPDSICVDQTNIPVTYTITGWGAPYDIYYKVAGNSFDSIATAASFTETYASFVAGTVHFLIDSVRYNGGLTCTQVNITDSITIVNPLPTASFFSASYEHCEGTLTDLELVLTGSGPITFEIRDELNALVVFNSLPAGTHAISVSPTTNKTYTVTQVNDNLGCVGVVGSSTSVTFKAILKVAIDNPAQICEDEVNIPVTYTITGSAGLYDIFYTADGADSSKLGINSPFTDTYLNLTQPSAVFHIDSVRYSAGLGCVQTDVADSTTLVNILPTATFIPAIYEQCEGTGTNLQLVLTGVGNVGCEVRYANGGVASTIGGIAPITVPISIPALLTDTTFYALLVQDDFGCVGADSNMATITIKDSLFVDILASGQICVDASNIPVQYDITGSTGPYSLYYSVNSGDSTKLNTGSPVIDIYPTLSTGNILFTVDSVEYATGLKCKQYSTENFAMAVNELPTVNLIETTDTLCEGTGTNLQFDVTGPGTIFVRYKSSTGALTTVSGPAPTILAPITPGIGDTQYFVDSLWNVSGASNCTNTFAADTTKIHVKEMPAISLTVNNPIVCQDDPVTFTAVVSGSDAAAAQGTFAFTYNINGTDTTRQLFLGTNSFQHTYTSGGTKLVNLVSIADASNPTCVTTLAPTFIELTVKSKATMAFDGDKTICEGTTAPLGVNFIVGTPPFQFVIDGVSYSSQNDTIINVAPVADSVFNLTAIVDGLGCPATMNIPVTVFVHQAPDVTFNVSADKVCVGSNVDLQTTVTGGTPNFSLFFSGEVTPFNPSVGNGNFNFSRVVNTTTTYTLDSIGDNSVPTVCYFPLGISHTVEAISYPTAAISVLDNEICSGQTVDLSFAVTGAGIDTVYYHSSEGVIDKAYGPAPTLTNQDIPSTVGSVTYFTDSIIEGSGAGCITRPVGDQVVVVVNPTPTAVLTGGGKVCETNSTLLELHLTTTGTGDIEVTYADDHGGTYSYNAPAGTYTIPLTFSNVNGLYRFTVTSVTSSTVGSSCPGATGSFTDFDITAKPQATIQSNNTNIVAGGTATLKFAITGGEGPWDIEYSDGTTTFTLINVSLRDTAVNVSPGATTTYSILNVIDKGTVPVPCESGPQGDITIIVTNHVAGLSGNATICLGECFPAFVSFNGDGPYTITVGDGNGNNQSFSGLLDQAEICITPAVTGTLHYTILEIIDEPTNTASSDSYGDAIVNVVQQKTVTISGNSTICEGQSSSIVFDLVGTGTFNVVYTDGTTDYSFNASAASSPVIKNITANQLVDGANTFTIKSVTNSIPNSVCPIVPSGSAVITVKSTPAVTLSLTQSPTCKDANEALIFNFASTGPFDVDLVTDSGGITTETLLGISSGHSIPLVAYRNMTFTVTGVRYSTGNLCTNNTQESIQLKVNNNPTGTISGNTSICEGQSAGIRFIVGGKLPINVVYTDGVVNSSFTVYNTLDTTVTVSPAGTITYSIVSINDGNSPMCSATGTGSATVTVIENPNVAIALSDEEICQDQTSRLKFTCSGVPPFTITYTENNGPNKTFMATTTGESELVVNPSVSTTYTLVSVVDGSGFGCNRALSGSDFVTVYPLPNASLSTQTPEVCEGATVKLRVDLVGEGDISVTIVDNTNTYLHQFTGIAGTYFVDVNPAIGTHIYTVSEVSDNSPLTCTRFNASSLTVKVNQKPTATLTSTSEVCEGNTVNLEFDVVGSGLMTVYFENDQGGSGSYTTTGGFTNLVVDPFPATGTIKYYITAIESQNGVVCTGISIDTAIVKVFPNPVVSITSTQKTICRGDETQLKFSVLGNGPFEIDFTDGTTPFTITPVGDSDSDGLMDVYFPVSPSQTTTFRVLEVRDNSSPTCSNQSIVAYTINVNQKPTASISGNNIICEGDSTTLTFVLTGKAPLTVFYSGDGASHTLGNLQPGVLVLDTVKPHAPSAIYQVDSIIDANAPACVTKPGQGAASITVNERPQGTINAVPSPICSGQSALLKFAITGGTPPYTIVYLDGGTADTVIASSNTLDLTVAPTATTTYELLSITDASSTKCSSDFSGVTSTLVVNSLATATVDVAPNTVCEGEAVTLTFKAKGGSTIDINYNHNGVTQAPVTLTTDNDNDGFLDATVSTIPVVPVSGTTSYYAITSAVVNETGCTITGSDSAFVVVNPTPTASVASAIPSTVCFGDISNVRFDITGLGLVKVVFAHKINAIEVKRDSVVGLAANSPLIFQAVPFDNTTYEIISVSSVNNGIECVGTGTGSQSASVTVNARPKVSLSLNQNPICANDAVSVTVDFVSGVSPFDIEYVVKNNTIADSGRFDNIGSGFNFFTQSLTDTTVIYIHKITDNGSPACISKDSTAIVVNVNPRASAKMVSDSTFCVNQQEGFLVDLVGVGNISFRYKEGANQSAIITRPAGRHFIPVNQSSGVKTYSFVPGSLIDQSIPSCLGIASGTSKVTVISAPAAIFTGISGVCEGTLSTITVELTGSNTDSITAYYHDNFGTKYAYRNKPGIYDVPHTPADSSVYTPDSVTYKKIGCPGNVTGKGVIDVRPTPTGSIDLVTEMCKGQTATATFTMDYDGPFDLTYQIGTNPPVVKERVLSGYQVDFNPNSSTTVKIKEIVYSDIPLCTAVNVASASVTVNDSLKVIASAKDCNDTNTGFTVNLTIGGGKPGTYTVNDVPVVSPYTSPVIPNGVYTFVVEDASGCPAVTISGNDTCACTSRAGTMSDFSLTEYCVNTPAITFHNGDEVKDANDTLTFILTDDGLGKLGNVIATNSTPGFQVAPGMVEYGKVYYIAPVVSDFDSVKIYTATDRCISIGAGKPVVFRENTTLKMEIMTNDSGYICKNDSLRLRFDVTGNGGVGPYTVILNPGFGADVTIDIPQLTTTWFYTIPGGVALIDGAMEIKSFVDESTSYRCEVLTDFDGIYPYQVKDNPISSFGDLTDRQVCAGEPVQFITDNNDNPATYAWVFGDGPTSAEKNPIHLFYQAGTYSPTLTVTNQFGCTSTSTSLPIEVQAIPEASFSISPSQPWCYGASTPVTFSDGTVYPPGGTVQWFINNVLVSGLPVYSHTFNSPGSYEIELVFSSSFGCRDTAPTTIPIEGPVADLFITSPIPCVENDYVFELKNVNDVQTRDWRFIGAPGPGAPLLGGIGDKVTKSFPRNFPNAGSVQAVITLTSANGCKFVIDRTFDVFQVTAKFDVVPQVGTTDDHCFNTNLSFVDQSSSNSPSSVINNWNWTFGDANCGILPSNVQNPPQGTYAQAGNYTIVQSVSSSVGCTHADSIDLVVFPLPVLWNDSFNNCPGQEDTLHVTNTNSNGANTIFTWTDSQHIVSTSTVNDTSLAIVQIISATNDTIINFTVTATDINSCQATSIIPVHFYNLNAPQLVNGVLDTSYVIGYELPLSELDDNYFNLQQVASEFNYSWTPDVDLSCSDCAEPTIRTMEDQSYVLTISDIYGCYLRTAIVNVTIERKESLDLPDAFTPNGDGINDVIFPDGHALQEVEEFKIFNRWGDVIHHASGKLSDIGWDGKIGGKLQQQDAYSYTVTIKTHTGKTLTKKGKFTLIR